MKKFTVFAWLLFGLVSTPHGLAKDWRSSSQMSDAATALIQELSEEQREAARFAFDDEVRGTWSNLPVLAVPPSGVMMADMNDTQRRAVQALLRASMSSQGYAKFTGVMALDEVLREVAQARLNATPVEERSAMDEALVDTRDPTKYAVAIFGDPGSDKWGWRLAGHHAAANFTVSEGRVSFTPTFLGSSPRVVEEGEFAGRMALPHEGDRGLELMIALDSDQQARARITDELPDGLFAGPGRKESLSDYEGLAAGEMNATQKRLLRVLVGEYVGNADFDAADAQLQAIDSAGWDRVRFSWRGPTEADGRFYYRVHGPRILIEYHRVDPNHDHSIVRDPSNDYGTDWLGAHIEEHHPTMEEIRSAMQRRLETDSDN